MAATRAPCAGGLEYMGRTMTSTVDRTAAADAASAATMCSAPSRSQYMPMFFANDWHTIISKPRATKRRSAAASVSRSPLAKPW